jgi:2-C-methyl-D-erythritol 4-phosphate cytidylyltransferase
MNNIAIILAGGTGSRLGYDIPKQFFKVAGKTVIEHTIDIFETHPQIDEIAIVSHTAYIAEIENMILTNGWKKVKKILRGGNERYESSISAIDAYAEQPNCKMIFHDAVRPLLSHRIIDDLIAALEKYNAVDVAVPAIDTIIQVEEQGRFIENIPNRKYLRRGQTPQAFRLKTIQQAYEIGLKDPNFVSSDDCGTVVKYLPNEKVFVVTGEESNMKLTYKEDSYLLDKLFQLKSHSLQNDVDFNLLKNKVIVIFGGNSGIGKAIATTGKKFGAKVFSFSRSTTNTDISDRKSVKKALLSVFEKTGKIDFVVNSAALLVKEPLAAMQENVINQVIAANYNGMVNVAIESYEYLKQSAGQLLLYTSSSYTRGRAFYSLYSSTKAAAVNFAQALAQEWEPAKIRINVINPERTKTPMRTKNFGNEPDETLLKTDKVAMTSLQTLLSDFTGQIIDVKRE